MKKHLVAIVAALAIAALLALAVSEGEGQPKTAALPSTFTVPPNNPSSPEKIV